VAPASCGAALELTSGFDRRQIRLPRLPCPCLSVFIAVATIEAISEPLVGRIMVFGFCAN